IPPLVPGRSRRHGTFNRSASPVSRLPCGRVLQPPAGEPEAPRLDRQISVEKTGATLASSGNLWPPQTPLPCSHSPQFLHPAGVGLCARAFVTRTTEAKRLVRARRGHPTGPED